MSLSESRARARRLENEIDSKLVQLGRPDGKAGSSISPQELEGLLQELSEVNDALCREAGAEGAAPGSTATTMHVLKRHREILHDFQQDFSKSKASLKAAAERNELLSSVREDIREHRGSASSRASATGALVRERTAIHASERAADDVIDNAMATRDALLSQRSSALVHHPPRHKPTTHTHTPRPLPSTHAPRADQHTPPIGPRPPTSVGARACGLVAAYGGWGSKLQLISSLAPQVNNLIGAIGRRKQQEKAILGAVIGLCCFVLFVYGVG